jgi:hypothetical protein
MSHCERGHHHTRITPGRKPGCPVVPGVSTPTLALERPMTPRGRGGFLLGRRVVSGQGALLTQLAPRLYRLAYLSGTVDEEKLLFLALVKARHVGPHVAAVLVYQVPHEFLSFCHVPSPHRYRRRSETASRHQNNAAGQGALGHSECMRNRQIDVQNNAEICTRVVLRKADSQP